MKKPNRAPAYAMLYHGLASVARNHGYALSIHGSMIADLDLVAIPWIEEADDAKMVMEAIKYHCGRCGVNLDEYGNEHLEPEKKPHGRLSWKLHLHSGGAVDLSVMPLYEETE